MLNQILSAIGSMLGSMFPAQAMKAAEMAAKQDPSIISRIQNSLKVDLANGIKKDMQAKSQPSSIELGILMALGEMEARKQVPRIFWFTWTEQDLLDFLTNNVGVNPRLASEATFFYLQSIYDVIQYAENTEQLYKELWQNPYIAQELQKMNNFR